MRCLICVLVCCLFISESYAGGGSTLKEIAKRIFKSAPKSAGLTIRGVNRKLIKLSTRYGDDAVKLAQLTGYRGLKVMVNASDDAGRKMIGLFKRAGIKAVPLIQNAASRKIFLRYGDDAADAIIRHPGLAERMIIRYGQKGAKVIKRFNDKGARRLTKLFIRHKTLSRHGDQYLEVVNQYGAKALDFIWKNKGALAVAGVGVTFLNNPAPYINGTVKLATIPLSGVNWNWIMLPLTLIVFLAFGGMSLIRRIRHQAMNGN